MDDRLDRERQFHDHSYAAHVRRSLAKFYLAAADAQRWYRQRVEDGSLGADALEYGCGRGGAVGYLKQSARSVVGIDISEVAIASARSWEAQLPGDAAVRFERMDAESTTFGDDSFDLVCGSGILHHLDLGAGIAEVRRVLRPGGTAVFLEPLGHNPLIEWYRRRTPDMRSEDEHPLEAQDLRAIRTAFPATKVRYFALATLAVVPFRRWGWSRWLMRAAEMADRVLLRIPGLRRLAWIVVVEVRG